MARKAKRVRKKLTPAEQKAYAKKLAAVEAGKDDIVAQGKAVFSAHKIACQVVAGLKAERVKLGLSLSDIQERTGISRQAICKLEGEELINPTMRTLVRYAKAVGVDLELNITKPAA